MKLFLFSGISGTTAQVKGSMEDAVFRKRGVIKNAPW